MLRALRIGLAIVVLGLTVLIGAPIGWDVFVRRDERTLAVFHDSRGAVRSGVKFGVRVGSSWTEADKAIRRQFEPGYVVWDGPDITSSDEPKLKGKAEVAYRDRSWRNGVITLELNDGRVTAIHWHYPGPFYIDL